ncbi:glycosyltransferase family 2 protein [Brevundimonas lutea]|uniref:glycosyltransferase family 2 protein n=1 Tax=Brevundimonas lutea TaxID=2293980 RepID=UPI000F0200CA|nr:glycosyltransferase family A protein [Brevundimonas lutea]
MSSSEAWSDIRSVCRNEVARLIGVDADNLNVGLVNADTAFLIQAFAALSETGFANEALATAMVRCLASDSPDVDIARVLFAQLCGLGLDEPAELVGRALMALGDRDPDTAIQLARVKLWRSDFAGAIALAAPLADEGNNLGAEVVMAEIGLASGAAWTEDYLLMVFSDNRRQASKYQRLLAQIVIGREDVRIHAGRWRNLPSQTLKATRQMASAILLHAKQPLPAELLSLDFLDSDEERRLWRSEARFQRDGDLAHVVTALNTTFAVSGLRPLNISRPDAPIRLGAFSAGATVGPRHGPLVSVIMTAHAAGETIDYALASILDQSYLDIEVIVVDDASDPPLEIAVPDPRVRLVRLEQNAGPYVARNVGLAEAKGAFIAFQDADDWAHPDKVARQVELLAAHPEAMATFARHVRMDRNGDLILENDFHFIGDGPVTSLYRREVFDRLGGFAPVRTRGDLEFKARVSAAFGGSTVLQDVAVLLIALSWRSNSKVQSAGAKSAQLKALKRRYAEEHKLAFFTTDREIPNA